MRMAFLLLLGLTAGCQSSDQENSQSVSLQQVGTFIYRKSEERLFSLGPLNKAQPPIYPWDKEPGNHPIITKEFFRCRGSQLNPCRIVKENDNMRYCFDCGGMDKHSLPIKDGKEFIYPILIELLNDLQTKSGKRVVITSGHRCPEHHQYADPSRHHQCSKHMIGAEVSFYLQGLENSPEIALQYLQEFYKDNPRYCNQQEYITFQRYAKEDTDVVTPPWYNKEVYIKIYRKDEGRNFDNRHPYPYLSIQVCFDREANEKVFYTWEKAFHHYHRY